MSAAHAPLPWRYLTVGAATASGLCHLYMVDANGRKIAAIWGRSEEKFETVALILDRVNAGLVNDRICRVCGCTETNACMTADGPCHWLDESLCSACAAALPHVVSLTETKGRLCRATCACGWTTEIAGAASAYRQIRDHWILAVAVAAHREEVSP